MLPPPPPFPYDHQTLKGFCDRLSGDLQPWAYPGGILMCHWVGSNLFARSTISHQHTHPFYEGFIVLQGALDLVTTWETQPLATGSVLTLSPGTVHQWHIHSASVHLLVFSFDLDQPLVTPPHRRWPVCPEILWSVLLLCEEIQANQPGWPLRAHGHLGAIYATLLSLIAPQDTKALAVDSRPQLVARVDELLRANLATPITLAELAGQVSMSARHLTRLFRAQAGITVHERLEALRMERAAQLLRRTNLPVVEIACAVGITNAAYFANRFRQRFEFSPHEFRRRNIDSNV